MNDDMRGIRGRKARIKIMGFLLMPYRRYEAPEWTTGFDITCEIAIDMMGGEETKRIPIFDGDWDASRPNQGNIVGWAAVHAALDGVFVGELEVDVGALDGATHLVPMIDLDTTGLPRELVYLTPTNKPQFDDVGKLPPGGA